MTNYLVVGEDEFAEKLARELQTEFIKITTIIFPDREVKTRMNVSALRRIGSRTALVVIRAKRYAP
ncbi:MAG: hypothetical protein OEZ25_06830, partial [Candidatus Bathyarchaeota archaeon]|nr:hypothetical protein [Candidatus Bathyarchaeota archaeon]